jgi:hypothetical protein
VAETVNALIVFEPATFPKKFVAPRAPFTIAVPLAYNKVEPVSLTHRFEPTLRVFVGFTFEIPTFVVVTRDANAFESLMRMSVSLPCSMVVSSV